MEEKTQGRSRKRRYANTAFHVFNRRRFLTCHTQNFELAHACTFGNPRCDVGLAEGQDGRGHLDAKRKYIRPSRRRPIYFLGGYA